MSITPAQCRAARALLEVDQASLAEAANVSRNTVIAFEKGQRVPNANNLLAIQAALENMGVEFVLYENGAEGVAWRPIEEEERESVPY